MLDVTRIQSKLEQLQRLDRKYKIFGATSHKYQLNPTLSEAQVKEVETHYKMKLPEDYRRFLIEVGNGGAGPAYGVFKLGEEDDNYDFCSWDEGGLIGDLSKPFRHKHAWNLPASFWQQEPSDAGVEEFDKLWDAWQNRVDETYYNPTVMNGAIPICHLGCALRHWLVICGAQAGSIWVDDRTDKKGIAPLLLAKGEQASFATWYEAWLDESLETFKKQ